MLYHIFECVFLLWTLLVVSCTAYNFDNMSESMLRKSLVDFLSVRCSADHFSVQMDYDLNRKPSRLTATLSDIIWRSRICLDDKPGCCSQVDEIEKRLLITTPYHACNINETTYPSGFNYTATVKFTTQDNTKLYYTVTCRVPFRKEVSKPVLELVPADPQLKVSQDAPLPLNTFMIGNVFPSDVTKEFHSFPMQCWTSVNGSTERKTIILNGCPMTDMVPDQLVSVYQDKLAEKSSFHYAEWTRFVLTLDERILPSSAMSRSQDGVVDVQFSCEIVYCGGQPMHGMMGIPLCPRAADYCADREPEIVNLPRLIKQAERRLATFSKTLRIDTRRRANYSVDGADIYGISPRRECVGECTISVILAQRDLKRELDNAVRSAQMCNNMRREDQGMPIWLAFTSCFLAFLVGIGFVAALWYINVKTDPQRKICHEANQMMLPESYAFTTRNGTHGHQNGITSTARSPLTSISSSTNERNRLIR